MTHPMDSVPMPEGKAVVRGPVSAFKDPECGTLVDFDCEGPLSHDPEEHEELFTADQLRAERLSAHEKGRNEGLEEAAAILDTGVMYFTLDKGVLVNRLNSQLLIRSLKR